jgi:DNA-binding response OmpR family regulator
MFQLVVVDDDQEIRELLSTYLCKNGYQVKGYESGEELLAGGLTGCDLIILDIGLPGIDGLEVCRQVRQFSQIPIIMLTAAADDVDRILGLEIGADDYLGKPFNPRELLARIKALLRRTQSHPETESSPEKCRLVIDKIRRKASYDGQDVKLTGAEFDLLHLLNEHRGEVISREQLSLKLKGHHVHPLDRSIDTQVSRLRAKLSDLTGENVIKSIRGKGYQLASQ